MLGKSHTKKTDVLITKVVYEPRFKSNNTPEAGGGTPFLVIQTIGKKSILRLTSMGVFAYPPETSTPFRGDMQKPPHRTAYDSMMRTKPVSNHRLVHDCVNRQCSYPADHFWHYSFWSLSMWIMSQIIQDNHLSIRYLVLKLCHSLAYSLLVCKVRIFCTKVRPVLERSSVRDAHPGEEPRSYPRHFPCSLAV